MNEEQTNVHGDADDRGEKPGRESETSYEYDRAVSLLSSMHYSFLIATYRAYRENEGSVAEMMSAFYSAHAAMFRVETEFIKAVLEGKVVDKEYEEGKGNDREKHVAAGFAERD